MNEQQIKARVHTIIRKQARLGSDAPVAPEHQLHGDLGLKVLDTLQVVMDVEDAWPGAVYFTDEQAEALHTVADVEQMVLAQLARVAT